MTSFIQSTRTYVADKAPVVSAYLRRALSGGPKFKRSGSLWSIEDDTGKVVVPYIRRYGMYLPSVGSRIDRMLQRYNLGDLKGALVLDVGSHVGEFAMAASPKAKQVICFEPDPSARQALMENTGGLKNVKVMPIALSNETKKSKLFVATEHADSSLFQPDSFTNVIEVDARRLDSLNIDVSGFSRVVLKMDAEGFEPEVLQGGGEWLKNLHTAAIDVAPERAGSDTYREVKQLLEAAGMREVSLSADQVLVMTRS